MIIVAIIMMICILLHFTKYRRIQFIALCVALGAFLYFWYGMSTLDALTRFQWQKSYAVINEKLNTGHEEEVRNAFRVYNQALHNGTNHWQARGIIYDELAN